MKQTPQHNKIDLSYINTLKDLKREIVKVKADVEAQEKEIIERFKKMPKETAIVAARAVVPLIAKRGVPTRLYNLVTNGIGLFISLRKQRKGIQAVISRVKQMIIMNVLGRAIKLYQQKRNQRKATAVVK